MGRKPINGKAMTATERQQARRLRLKETQHTVAKKRGRPPLWNEDLYKWSESRKRRYPQDMSYWKAGYTALGLFSIANPNDDGPLYDLESKKRFAWLEEHDNGGLLGGRQGLVIELGRMACAFGDATAREYADIICAEKPSIKDGIAMLRGARLFMLRAAKEDKNSPY